MVSGRWPGAALAAVGVLLAVPSIVWPVLVIRYVSPYDESYSGSPFGQGIWGWGKYAQLSEEGNDSAFAVVNTVGLVFLVASLAVGLGGVLAWAFFAGSVGRSVGLAATCFAAVAQLGLLSQWAGQQLSGFYSGGNGIGAGLEPSGWLHVAAGGVLVVAIGFMLWRPLRAWLVPTLRRLTGGAPGAAVVPEVSHGRESSPHPIGQARRRAADDHDEPSRPVAGPTVGFSDEGADGDRTSGSEPS